MTVSGKNEDVTSSAHGASTAAAGKSRERCEVCEGSGEIIKGPPGEPWEEYRERCDACDGFGTQDAETSEDEQ